MSSKDELLVADEINSALELPSLRVRRSVSILPYGPNRDKAPTPITLDSLSTFAKLLLRTAPHLPGSPARGKLYIVLEPLALPPLPVLILRLDLQGDDQCVCEVDESGKMLRKFDFYSMVHISGAFTSGGGWTPDDTQSLADFCPEPERDCLLVTDSAKHHLLIFNCKQQQMITVRCPPGQAGGTRGARC